MNLRLLILLMTCCCQFSDAAEPTYLMKDLRALADQGAWGELAAHLEDIRPADRSAEWNKVLEQTAVGILDQSDAYSALSTGEAMLARFPKLKTNKPFMAKRAEAGLKAFAVCFQDNYGADQCLQDMTQYCSVSRSG